MATIREFSTAHSEEETTDIQDELPQKASSDPPLRPTARGPRGPPSSAPSLPTVSSSSQSAYVSSFRPSAQSPLRWPYSSFQLSTQQYLPNFLPPARRSISTFQPQPFTQRSLPTFQPSTQLSFPNFRPSTQQSLQLLRNRKVRDQIQDTKSYTQRTGNKKALIVCRLRLIKRSNSHEYPRSGSITLTIQDSD